MSRMKEIRKPRSIEKMKEPYVLAKKHDWEGFRVFFLKHKDLLDKHVDLHQSTPFHYAVHSDSPRIYSEMLGMVDDPSEIQHVLRLQDEKGNTPLHEVALTREPVKMAAIILNAGKTEETEPSQYVPLQDITNKLGETPVYRAAALGNTNLLKFFVEDKSIDLTKHFLRTRDRMSTLHLAVIGQHFGTALWLLKRHEELADLKEDSGLTTLQLLAKMNSTFKSQTQMGAFTNFIYLLLPNHQDYKYYLQTKEDTRKGEDLERGKKGRDQPPQTQRKLLAFSWMWHTMWKAMAKVSKRIRRLWRKKVRHKLAEELVYLLAKKDRSWERSSIAMERTVSMWTPRSLTNEPEGKGKKEQREQVEPKDQNADDKPVNYTPLLMAACNGIMEIVEVIIRLHPQSVEHVSEDEQNILDMVVKNRQLEIYRHLKKLKMVRMLAGKIDQLGNTVLHYTADFQGGHQPGYALQLQEELQWFERIEKRIPYQYTMHCNMENRTAKQLFLEKHHDLLIEARKWIKETAQSCSAVAVLVATVVFAAAYTVPGGTDNNTGLPKFLHRPIFVVFTVMDVVSLASSLASVVMFLSILTSPCEMWDFRRSLPRKLMAGFALLFFSMATTMMSFSSTILINLKLQKNKCTETLTYIATFFPICIFAMIAPRYFRYLLERRKTKKIWGSFVLAATT